MFEFSPNTVNARRAAIRSTTRSTSKEATNDQEELPFSTPAASSQIADPASSKSSLSSLRRAAAGCQACDLWKHATQTVFGEGSQKATIMFVGEQPGDREDLAGRPFVGPAGNLLDEALREAHIDRSVVYVTNIVKHFKWVPSERGKRRIHKKPRYSEILACRPWLDAEIRLIRPEVLVCLGATAAQSLLGKTFSVTRQRGQVISSTLVPKVVATVHPSSILRAPDPESRKSQMETFVRDLKKIARLVKK
jgi:uracil-DNA glycosylase family protein